MSTLSKYHVIFVGFDIDIRLLGGCKTEQQVAITIAGKWQ
jgi:hypothetical protein